MGDVCPRCGGPTKETDVFCGKCGLNLAAQSAPAAQPAPVQKKAPSGAVAVLRTAANSIMRYISIIMVVLCILTLVLGIMNFAAKHDVKVTAVAKYSGETQRNSEKVELAEIYETDEFLLLAIAGYGYAVLNIALTGFAGFILFKLFTTGVRKTKKLVKIYGLVGLAGNAGYLLLAWIFGTYREEYSGVVMKAIVSPHFTVWLSLLLFGILFAAAMLSKTKRRRRPQLS